MLADAGISPGVMKPFQVLVQKGGDPDSDRGEDAQRRRDRGRELRRAAPAGAAARTRSSRRSRRSTAPRPNIQDVVDRANDALAGTTATLGGTPAVDRDFIHAVYGNFPYVLAFVVILTLILLARAFRSIVLPIKAAVLNLISLAAAFGIIVFIFQKGHGSSLWNIDCDAVRSRRGSR